MSLLASFGPWIVGILSAVGAAFAVFASAKKAGKAEGRAEAAEKKTELIDKLSKDAIEKSNAANATQTKAVENANEVRNDVSKLGDGDAVGELRNKWQRD